MDIAFEHIIRERAYAFWLAAGMADGDAEHHWLHAERVVRDETGKPSVEPASLVQKASGKEKAVTAKAAKAIASKPTSAKPTAAKSTTAESANSRSASIKSAAPRSAKSTGTRSAEATI